MFKSRYPMVALAMNQVSDLKLAVACSQAGIVASISVYNYQVDRNNFHWAGIDQDIKKFQEQCPDGDLIMSIGSDLFLQGQNSPLVKVLADNKIKYAELIERKQYEPNQLKAVQQAMQFLTKQGVLFIYKVVGNVTDPNTMIENCRSYGALPWAIEIKGPDGAGRVKEGQPLVDRVKRLLEAEEKVEIIATGGISTPEDVRELLDLGILAVGCGTPFAVCEESRINPEVKLNMIAKSWEDLQNLTLKRTEVDNVTQRALVFTEEGRDPFNNTKGLKTGIYVPGRGHVFAGRALGSINSIRTVQETVNYFFADYRSE
jgi:NAD(P)H-dependent flavin oxidoreductase YrpB (nitropropane dioxygenase family)